MKEFVFHDGEQLPRLIPLLRYYERDIWLGNIFREDVPSHKQHIDSHINVVDKIK